MSAAVSACTVTRWAKCWHWAHGASKVGIHPRRFLGYGKGKGRDDSFSKIAISGRRASPAQLTSSLALSSVPSSVGCVRQAYRPVGSVQVGVGIREPEPRIEPYKLVEDDLRNMWDGIHQELRMPVTELLMVSSYYFDGQGKAVRPMITTLMARAINAHLHQESFLLPSQWKLAMITEMIHTASLVHDDVIDRADTRRGKASVNRLWGPRKAILAGDYILSTASKLLARMNNCDVFFFITQILQDLIHGEFMQMKSLENESERYAQYLAKTYKKTASLLANGCKAVANLGGADESLQEAAFQYGRNIGIAFQLVDDLLDFISSTETLGKPAAADLKLGLATAPVLFASQKFPELHQMIIRRFSEPGDVQKAFDCVFNSDGLAQTRFLAQQHCHEAVKFANLFRESSYQKALVVVTDKVLNRMK